MRRTWLSDAPADGSLVVRFVIGRAEDPYVARALQRELEVYNDVLIPPFLDLRRRLQILVPKTKAFASYAFTTYPSASYVMLCDDDVLVDVDRLLEAMTTGSLPSRRFYAGQVWAEHFRKPTLYRNGRRRIGTTCLKPFIPCRSCRRSRSGLTIY